MKIAINGFGRIGRSVVRALLQRDDIELVAINDLMDINEAAYLIRNDTIRGVFEDVEVNGDILKIGNHKAKFSNFLNPKDFNPEADVIIEATGKFLTTKEVKRANKKVIISAPATDDTPQFVLGVNEDKYNGESVISNASCTTNCLAPIAMILDNHFKIKKGFISTIHSYTMDQKLLDSPNKRDLRRSRAAATNIIPTFTGAAKAIYKILPSLKGKLDGRSVRVPVANVSLLDLVVEVERETTTQEVNELIKEYANSKLKGILGVDENYLVSSDIIGRSESSIVALDLTQVNSNLIKIFSWYDNEWGYANRLLDMAKYILL